MTPPTPRIRKVRDEARALLDLGRINDRLYNDILIATDDGCEWDIPAIEKVLDEASA